MEVWLSQSARSIVPAGMTTRPPEIQGPVSTTIRLTSASLEASSTVEVVPGLVELEVAVPA